MRMKKILILAVAATALVACAKSFDKSDATPQEIGFSTWAEHMTKATIENTFEIDDNFNVWGEKLVGETHTDVFTGVTVTKTVASPETWNYDTKQYWDLSATSYTFYGVSPAASGYTVDETTGAISPSPEIEFTGKNSDILVAQKTVVNKTDGSGNFNSFAPVQMVFNHVASLLDVKVKISAGLVAAGATVKVSSIELQNISTKGTFTVTGGYTTAPAAVWTPSTPSAATTGAFDSADGFTDVSSNLNTALNGTGTILINKLVVMPQDFRSTGDFIQKLDIDYNITQTGGTANEFTPDAFALTTFDNVDNTTNTEDTNVTGWAAGTHYTYVITIDANTIEFTAKISEWTPAANEAYHYLIN